MKSRLILVLLLFTSLAASAQLDIKTKKYPSLLWEISGKGMKKPSFLIGTMHVSNKMAFNLPDSFYYAIRNAQVVALETNPETWQEDMSRYDISGSGYGNYGSLYGSYSSVPSEYLGINTLKYYRYNKKIERALYSNPSAINNLLYRSYGNESSDFEEDTYLDMYIFQCGKKWGKKVAGVEDYGESMRLMAEAYKDAAKDKTKKERSYGDWDEAYSTEKLQEAYRRGNLDLLDTINKYNSFSAAFDEKFLYRRNEIQARSIDSIIRSGAALFVGVGAAHLPGDRGVIEMLRRMGYKLRPVKMGERASREKDLVDKIRVPVIFRTDTADDGLFRVDIPGKFYEYGDDAALDQQQCADMANGSYYLVTRIMTNGWMWNHNTGDVYRVVDSLLYENVPGKIISKGTVTKNGYKGFDIVNRTRRGDMQRYQIFITPFEIIIFKMSGNGEYVKNGPEADKFFGSIQFREYRNGNGNGAAPKKYSPSFGGFAVDLPHEPYVGNDGSWIYDAADRTNGIQYRVVRTDVHNYHFAGEDTFDLALMEESFMASEFIDTQLSRQQTVHKGYPALEGKYRDKNGSLYFTRFIIQGPHYYTLIARAKQEQPAIRQFIQSFEIKPLVYGSDKLQRDTSLYFSVATPWYPEEKKIKLDIPQYSYYGGDEEEEEQSEDDLLESGTYRNKVISNDSTGEKIFVSFFRSSRYHYLKDSSVFEKDSKSSFFSDSLYITRFAKKSELPGKTRVWESIISDTSSSRALWTKVIYKNGNGYSLATQLDTLTAPSAFVKRFFETFDPADTLKGVDPFEKKSALFFADFFSPDTVLHKRAVNHIGEVYLDSSDLPRLKKAIASLNWKEKKYLDVKKEFINVLGGIPTRATADYLKELYYALDDTVQLQYAVLENLLQHRTGYAYRQFGDIIDTEAPVLDFTGIERYPYSDLGNITRNLYGIVYKDGKFLDELTDTLALTKMILPELLPLLNLEDYKEDMMALLGLMVDSNLLQAKDYEMYFSKFLVEAKQELKKQAIAEKRKAIEKAEESKTDKKKPSYLREEEADSGNADLSLYATLLLPFMDNNTAVGPVIQQMLRSGDKRLRYNTFMQLLKKGKPYPDTLLVHFAGMDEYRYELYSDLKEQKKEVLFPKQFNNHPDLGKSALLDLEQYNKPDSVLFLDKLAADFKGRKGLVYFYKYKTRKDDLTWKLATVGLVPENPDQFEFPETAEEKKEGKSSSWLLGTKSRYDFTAYTDTRFREDEAVGKQLKKALKRLLYSRRNSAREFYKNDDSAAETEVQ